MWRAAVVNAVSNRDGSGAREPEKDARAAEDLVGTRIAQIGPEMGPICAISLGKGKEGRQKARCYSAGLLA